jgi:hypothetical protein
LSSSQRTKPRTSVRAPRCLVYQVQREGARGAAGGRRPKLGGAGVLRGEVPRRPGGRRERGLPRRRPGGFGGGRSGSI